MKIIDNFLPKEEFKKIHGRIERELDARVYKD